MKTFWIETREDGSTALYIGTRFVGAFIGPVEQRAAERVFTKIAEALGAEVKRQ